MNEGRARWLWAVLAVLAVGIVFFWLSDGDDPVDPPPGASQSAAIGRSVDGDRVCDIVPTDDAADAYGVEAAGLREAFVHKTSATTGVSCNVIHGTTALADVHLYTGQQAVDLWNGPYTDLRAGEPLPGSARVPEDLGEGIVQDHRRVVVHRPCRSAALLLVLSDPTRRLSSDELVRLAQGALPPARDLLGCP